MGENREGRKGGGKEMASGDMISKLKKVMCTLIMNEKNGVISFYFVKVPKWGKNLCFG